MTAVLSRPATGVRFEGPDGDGIGRLVLDRPDDAINALNPELVESLSHIIAERRAALAASAADMTVEEESEGLISSIRRFFGLG